MKATTTATNTSKPITSSINKKTRGAVDVGVRKTHHPAEAGIKKTGPKKRKKVYVAMSGGVDSSVAAWLLKEDGYDVTGVTMQLLTPDPKDDFYRDFGGCCSLDTIEDAKRVAETIGIPHYVLNFRRQFKKYVFSRFLSEYSAGRTPNPCVDCNQFLKFKILMEKIMAQGGDLIATGHYARTQYDTPSNRWFLKKGVDPGKDQTYFLFTMTQRQLASTLFPLGELHKKDVRAIAAKIGLKVADKKDSQEICFIPDNDTKSFLKNNIPGAKEGEVRTLAGEVLGWHEGALLYTVGQRKGLGVAVGKPAYVVRTDTENNVVYLAGRDDLLRSELTAVDMNFIYPKEEVIGQEFTIKIRHRCEDLRGTIAEAHGVSESSHAADKPSGNFKITFQTPAFAVAPGQAVVLYDGDNVAAGGIIER